MDSTGAPDDGRVALGGTSWRVWRHFVLRSTALSLPELTAAISGEEPADAPPDARVLARALEVASQDTFTMALLWQNPEAVDGIVDALARSCGSDAITGKAGGRARRRAERGQRWMLRLLGQYLQRYYARNESVGFFGPVVWGAFEEEPAACRMSVKAGAGLTDQRNVMFEDWAIHQLGLRMSRPREVRRLLPPALVAEAVRMGRTVLRKDTQPRKLSKDEMAVLDVVNGHRTAAEIGVALGDEEGTLALLETLTDDGVLNWSFDIPVDLWPEKALERQLRELPLNPAVERALAWFEELMAARSRVEAAETSADLANALEYIGQVYSQITGRAADRDRTEGERGFRLLVGADRRDIRITLGTRVLEELAEPLGLVLDSARWLCCRVGEQAEEWFAEVYAELADMYGAGRVPLNTMIGQLGRLFWDETICARRMEEFGERWQHILRPGPDARRLNFTSAEFAQAVGEEFASDRPSWYVGRHHSPDLMIMADSVEAVNRGDYQVVMGELHAGMVTFDTDSMTCCCDNPAEAVLRPAEAALKEGPPRFLALHHRTGGQTTGFNYPVPETYSRHYSYLSFGERTGARRPPREPVPAAAITVRSNADHLEAILPDGRTLPLLTVLGEYLTFQTASNFRLLPDLPHTPRVTVDRVIIARERWRIASEELVPDRSQPREELHRQVIATAERHGIPRYCYWRSVAGAKPIYLDLHSSLFVHVLVESLVRGRLAETVTFTEMLPSPDELWLPDGSGRRYTSELRIAVADA